MALEREEILALEYPKYNDFMLQVYAFLGML
jgi:hypothetical protein